jgi:soluble lytic murein transglycosylase
VSHQKGYRARRTQHRTLLAAALSAVAAAAAAADDPYEDVRAEFIQAYTIVDDSAADAQDSTALRSYPLYPYLQRARIARALDTAGESWTLTDDNAQAFLLAHDAEPVARDLRRAWLDSLARRNALRAFVDHYGPDIADAQLHCRFLAAKIELGESAGLEQDVIERWLTPARLPSECEPLFEWLRTRPAMTEALIEQRVRLLLQNGETGFARVVARRLSAPRAVALLQWADLLDNPLRSIDALFAAPTAAVERDALIAGWSKLARNDPAAALERFELLAAMHSLDAELVSSAALALALGLAWDRRPEAEAFFARVAAADLDDYALTWRARAALWSGAWRNVERSIDAMSAAQRAQPRWVYWAARAAEQRGARDTARALYRSVLASDNYYSAIAAARLGERVEPHPESLRSDAAQLRALASRPGFLRARELKLCELDVAAANEWAAEYSALGELERREAIHLAASWGWHDLTVATATRENVFFDYALLYPQPYESEVRAAARPTKLDQPLIYGVIRQESLFRANAISPAGAMGLAQLRPETARIVARAADRPAPRANDLLDPATNLQLAATHLRSLIDRFDDQIAVALAAYNAGPLAAKRWLPEQPMDGDIWLENVPYNETRDYVQRVLWHSVVFGWLGNGKGRDTKAWVAPIKPPTRTSDAS